MKVWLSNNVLVWSPWLENWSTRAAKNLSRPYTHWQHAEKLSDGETTEFTRIDIITTLKRAVDIRIRNLNDIYHFRDIQLFKKTKKIIELLSKLEIVRPMMISKLNRIRNTIEHHDKAPPSQEECKELVDFTWYFLRSTDILIQKIPFWVVYDPKAGSYVTPYGVTFSVYPDNGWRVEAVGWVEDHMISKVEKADWLIIECTKYGSLEDLYGNEWKYFHPDKNPSDIRIEGRLIGPPEEIKRFMIHYFQVR